LDYASVSAATGPFSIDSIRRNFESRERYTATIWQIVLNWPKGEIVFEGSGFTQQLRADPIIKAQQSLSHVERGGG
jgi:hypothetical protein